MEKRPDVKKFSVSMREDLLERADEYANLNGMTRSGLIALALSQYLRAVDAMPSMNKLIKATAAVTDSFFKGEIPPTEAKAKLDAIQSLYNQLSAEAPKI